MGAEKKEKGLVSRILKIVGITLAGFVVVVAGAIGIAILSGQFEKEVIQITRIYFDDDPTNTTKTIYTLDDIVTNIKYEPANATETKLKITVDGNENGVIESLPSTITAGKDFTIKVNKDSKGNNIGGVVSIRALTSNGFADVNLRVVVDTCIPNDSLYFSGVASNKVTTTGKSFTMPIKDEKQYVYLKSGLVNAFNFTVGDNENYKNVEISYVYNNEDPVKVTSSDGLTLEKLPNTTDGKYYYYYKIPIVADEPGTIEFTAKMHRTHEIEEEFNKSGFGDLVKKLTDAKKTNATETIKTQAILLLDKYRDFLNKYISYFDTTDESYTFFKTYLYGKAKLSDDPNDAETSLKYVYVLSSATVNVTAIELKDLTTIASIAPYKVFSTTKYSLDASSGVNSIEDVFDVRIKTSNDDVDSSTELKDYIKQNIVIKPYLYLSNDYIEDLGVDVEDEYVTWASRKYKCLPVYNFDEKTPIVKPTGEYPMVCGYLLVLTEQDEYMYISQKINISGEKQWEITCNTPLLDSGETINKALYIGFDVTGVSSEKDEELQTFYSFTKVTIDYDDYEFKNQDNTNIQLTTIQDMTINTSLENAGGLAVGRQNISIDYSNIKSSSNPSYTSIMYFVESESNKVSENVSKIATVGKYNFITFSNAVENTGTLCSYNNADLVGERIPTYDLNSTLKNYYIRALNASDTPVKIFAVVYLSDKSGNPIDINGRRITIDESGESDSVPLLVVVRYTSLDDMPESKINSYLDTVNFYTEAQVDYEISEGVKFDSGYLRRNVLSNYVKDNGDDASKEDFDKVSDYLKLKILKNNNFTFYLTPFEWDRNGGANDDTREENISVYDFSGKNRLDITYTIDTKSNKQIAFNTVCKNIGDYELKVGSDLTVIDRGLVGTEDSYSSIKYVVCTTDSSATSSSSKNGGSANWMIYLDASNCTGPYSPALSPSSQLNEVNNWVNYEINSLVIYDVDINYTSVINGKEDNASYSRLYAEYNTSGDQVFNYRSTGLTGDGYSSSEYRINLVDGDISYSVYTNMYDDDGALNLNVVDCSQAKTGNTERDDKTTNYFDNIDQYIAALITGNSANISYSTPVSVATFAETYAFTNRVPGSDGDVYDNYIYFGDDKFIFDRGSDYVNINGYEVALTPVEGNDQMYQIVISQGEYFPVIGTKMLIYNEEFEIHTTEAGNKYINDRPANLGNNQISIVDGANLLLSAGETKKYECNNYYINKDGGANQISAITVDGDTATVNFIQGEELGSYQLDPNGEYKKVVSDGASNKVSYVKIGSGENVSVGERYSIQTSYIKDPYGDFYRYFDEETQTYKFKQADSTIASSARYSKRGVVVYLLITFNLMKTGENSSEYTFYKTISYELVQENLEIIGYNNSNVINSEKAPYEISKNGGSKISIPMGASGNDSVYITTTTSNSATFFNYVTFSMDAGTTGIQVVKNNNNIEFNAPYLTSDLSAKLVMKYRYKGKDETKYFYITFKANVEFASKDGTKEIELTCSDNSYEVNEIIRNHYTYASNITVALTPVGNEDSYIYTRSENLYITKYYAEYNGSTVVKRSAEFNITLTVNGVKVPAGTVKIVAIPEKIVGLNNIKDITIFNGENINSEYIKLFEGSSTTNDVASGEGVLSSSNDAYKNFKITTTQSGVTINNGIIRLNEIPSSDTKITLKLSAVNYGITEREFTITIRGISMKYSPSGNVNTSGAQDIVLLSSVENKDITLDVEVDDFKESDYFDFSLANTEVDDTVVAVLLDENDNIVSGGFEAGKKYYLAYAKTTGGVGIIVCEKTGYTVTLASNDGE